MVGALIKILGVILIALVGFLTRNHFIDEPSLFFPKLKRRIIRAYEEALYKYPVGAMTVLLQNKTNFDSETNKNIIMLADNIKEANIALQNSIKRKRDFTIDEAVMKYRKRIILSIVIIILSFSIPISALLYHFYYPNRMNSLAQIIAIFIISIILFIILKREFFTVPNNIIEKATNDFISSLRKEL